MNGVRAIFLRELRAGLVPDVLVLLLALAVFTVVERALVGEGMSSEDSRQGVDLALFSCAVLLSFASGARTFSRETKTRRLLSLYTLPISRGALWCALTGGRLTAITAALAGLLLARLSMIQTLLQEAEPVLGSLIPLVALIPVLFMAGVCSSLTFENNATVYLAGSPLAIFSVFQAVGLANAGFSSWQPIGFAAWLWTLSLAVLLLAFLALSWRFFQMGDFTVRRRSLAKQALLPISLVCAFGLIGAVTHSTPLVDRSGPWNDQGSAASSGGLYLVIAERPGKRLGLSWLRIVETASGRVLATRMWHGLQAVNWSRNKQELHLLVMDHWAPEPWRSLLGPQPTWIRLSPEGKELSRFRLGAIHDFAFLPDGTILITRTADSKVQLIQLSQSTSLVIEEAPASPGRWSIGLYGHSQGRTVFSALGSRWRVENGKPRKLDPLEAQEADPLAERPLFRFLNSVRHDQRPSESLARFLYSVRRHDQRLSIFPPEGLALYLPTGDRDGLASLYDEALDREIPLPACESGRSAFPELLPIQSGPAFLVRFQCRAPGENIQSRHFYYLPGSGTVKPLPAFDRVMTQGPVLLAYLDETSAIWRSDDNKTWTALQGGKLRTLWPARH